MSGPTVTITWEKFRRTVLGSARKIEFYVPGKEECYTAILTAEDQEAPPIILWDTEENRNPFSWYVYSGGSTPVQMEPVAWLCGGHRSHFAAEPLAAWI